METDETDFEVCGNFIICLNFDCCDRRIAHAECFVAFIAFVTAACCILGMYSKDSFTMVLNIVTPCVLVALGMIMPWLAKRERMKAAK